MKTNFILLKLSLIIMFAILSAFQSQAQQPAITLDFPSVGDSNISRTPEIRLHVSYPWKIDSSCLNYGDVYYENNWDSTNNRLFITGIYVFQSSIYDYSDSSLQLAKMFCSLEKCTLLNDTTFKFINVYRLKNYTQYSLYFDDLRVYNSITGDTVAFDTIVHPYFTTCKPMFRVNHISSNGNSIRTGDTIFVEFNQDMPSITTPLGPILTLSKLDTNTIDDTTRNNYIDVPSYSFMGTTQNIICILPDTNFTIGQEYYLNINLNRLTGDIADNIFSMIKIKQKAMINTMVRNLDSTDSLPIFFSPTINTKTYFLDANEPLILDAPKYDSTFYFVGWECPGYNNLNGHTETSRTISLQPEQLQDLNITAVFAKIPQDTIKLNHVTGGSFSAFTPGTTVNDSVYTLPRKDGNKMLVIANPNSRYVFSHWVSNDSLLNGNTNPYLEINAYTGMTQSAIKTKSKIDKPLSNDPIVVWSCDPEYVYNFYPSFIYVPTNCSNAIICVTVSVEDGSEIFSGTSSNESNSKVKDLLDYVKIDTTRLNLIGENQTASGCYVIPNPNLPISKTISVKLSSDSNNYDQKYEIAYYYDSNNKFNIRKGRKFPEYQNGDTLFGLSADPYGDSVGTQFSQQLVLNTPDRCTIDLRVVLFRRRCYLTTEMAMSDSSFLPYPYVLNIDFSTTPNGSIANTNLGGDSTNPKVQIYLDTDLRSVIHKKIIWYKIIPYGDTIFIQNQLLKTDRGFSNGSWIGDNGYTNTPIIDNALFLIMNENKKTSYDYYSDFYLWKIRFTIRNSFYHTFNLATGYPVIDYPLLNIQLMEDDKAVCLAYYIPTPPYPSRDNLQDGDFEKINHSEQAPYDFKTAIILFIFHLPSYGSPNNNLLVEQNYQWRINEASLNTGNFLFGDNHSKWDVSHHYGLWGWDYQPGMPNIGQKTNPKELIYPRFDGQPLKNYQYNSIKDNIIYYQYLRQNCGQVTFKMKSPAGFGLPHMSRFIMEVTNSIKCELADENGSVLDASQLTLTNPGELSIYTEYPHIEVRLLNYDYNYNSVILSLAGIAKQNDVLNPNSPNYISNYNFNQIYFRGTRLPSSGCYYDIPPIIMDDQSSDLLFDERLYKDGQWGISSEIMMPGDCQNLDYIKIFHDTQYGATPKNLQNLTGLSGLDLKNVLLNYFDENIRNYLHFECGINNAYYRDHYCLEGFEKYSQDYNWGILAFPHYDDNYNIISYTLPDPDQQITDFNNFDKYRFLYLWRTYIVKSVTYKIRLY